MARPLRLFASPIHTSLRAGENYAGTDLWQWLSVEGTLLMVLRVGKSLNKGRARSAANTLYHAPPKAGRRAKSGLVTKKSYGYICCGITHHTHNIFGEKAIKCLKACQETPKITL